MWNDHCCLKRDIFQAVCELETSMAILCAFKCSYDFGWQLRLPEKKIYPRQRSSHPKNKIFLAVEKKLRIKVSQKHSWCVDTLCAGGRLFASHAWLQCGINLSSALVLWTPTSHHVRSDFVLLTAECWWEMFLVECSAFLSCAALEVYWISE